MDPIQLQLWIFEVWVYLSPALMVVALVALAALIYPFRFLWMNTRGQALIWLLGAVAMIVGGPSLPVLLYLAPEWLSAIGDYFGFMKDVPEVSPPLPPASPVL